MKDELLVLPHLEIGDQIVQNGICRSLASKHAKVAWAARHDNIDIVKAMYSDMPNVRVVMIHEYKFEDTLAHLKDEWKDIVRIGFFMPNGLQIGVQTDAWDNIFYENAGVHFDERWTSFALPPSMLPPPSEIVQIPHPIALAHECPERGCAIDRSLLDPEVPVVYIDQKHNFWDWLPTVLEVTELHFIDSAFLNLAESLYVKGYLRNTKLVFHEYSKRKAFNSRPPVLRAPWKRLL